MTYSKIDYYYKRSKKMKEITDCPFDYDFEVGDVVVWANGFVGIAGREQECIDEGITKDDAVSYFIYGIDKDTTERFDDAMKSARDYFLEMTENFDDYGNRIW